MFTTPCFIRRNSLKLRNKLAELGYRGFYETVDDILECNNGWVNVVDSDNADDVIGIDCGENEDLFLAIAALQDDSDYMQWFRDNYDESLWQQCTWGRRVLLNNCHKATVEELIEHFK